MSSISNGDLQSSAKPGNSIADLIGDWGPWQRQTVFLIFLCKIPAAWFMACIIFTAPFAKYGEFNCQQPNTGYPPANHTKWINIAHPRIDGGDFDYCFVYKNRTEALIEWQHQHRVNQSISDVEECNAFEHQSVFSSLVTQFDLVCSRTILIAVTQFFHLCGVLTGGILATKLLDM